MATVFLSNAQGFLPSLASTTSSSSSSSSSSSFSSSSSSALIVHAQNQQRRLTATGQIICKAVNEPSSNNIVTSRRGITLNLTTAATALLLGLGGGYHAGRSDAAILEADDDEELLEKVKRDRKKRLEKQGVISASGKETAYLQDLVYKLSKVGQAIEKNDLPGASSVLDSNKDIEWLQKVNSAFNKLSSSAEEKTEIETFNSSLDSLILSVSKNDVEASKVAFVASASAFEKWTVLTGLVEQLKGL